MNSGEIVIYQNQDGKIKIDVRLEEDTVWLTIEQMALLFGKAKSTINEHILNVFNENELVEDLCVRKIGNSDFSHGIRFCQFIFAINVEYVFINC